VGEQEVFAYLMHWIIHEMDNDESITIRYRVAEVSYQLDFTHHRRQLRVSMPGIISRDINFKLYEWRDDDTFNGMTVQMIQESIQRADEKNYQQHGIQFSDCEFMENLSTEQQQKLTAEDYKLIEEILEGC